MECLHIFPHLPPPPTPPVLLSFQSVLTDVQYCTLPVFLPYLRASLERAPQGSHCSSYSVTESDWVVQCSASWWPRRANSSPAAAESPRSRSRANPPRSEKENFSWKKRQFTRKIQNLHTNIPRLQYINCLGRSVSFSLTTEDPCIISSHWTASDPDHSS